MHFYLGIDPGPVNTGVAAYVCEEDSYRISTTVLSLKGYSGFRPVFDKIDEVVSSLGTTDFLQGITLERFVPYQGTDTSHAEIVNQFIGAFSIRYGHVRLVRALDWKMKLCKYHFIKTGFRNPSNKLDKECSLALAKHIFPEIDCPTDHEADALCIAHCGQLIAEGVNLQHTNLR